MAKSIKMSIKHKKVQEETKPDVVPMVGLNDMEHFDSPESSTVRAAFYDPEYQTMVIAFKDIKTGRTKSIYRYEAVPTDTWKAFKAAPSKGVYFHAEIKPNFPGKKL